MLPISFYAMIYLLHVVLLTFTLIEIRFILKIMAVKCPCNTIIVQKLIPYYEYEVFSGLFWA
jgi:hypothetical protein